jgi:ComF family protein
MPKRSQLAGTLQQAVDFFFPPVCAFCRRLYQVASQQPGICRNCLAGLPLRLPAQMQLNLSFLPAGLRIYAAAYCRPPLRQALSRLKSSDAPELAVALAGIMQLGLKAMGGRPEAVAAVPLHQKRLAERGYNQAGLLASLLASWLAVPDVSDMLARTRHTHRQNELGSHQARFLNMTGAFAPAADLSALKTEGRGILLVDDVLVSGATLSAAAKVFTDAGATVRGLVVASDRDGTS